MIKSLNNWIANNKLQVEFNNEGEYPLAVIDGVGSFFLLEPEDGKIINESFLFNLTREEFSFLSGGGADFILFQFGERFYYSKKKEGKDKYLNELGFEPEFNDFKYLGKTTEEEIMPFSHLGVHTEYEMLNGSGAADLWAKKASFMGVKSLGICDKNTLAGTLSFQTACEKKGIKSIIGETITIAVNYDPEKDIQETFELKLFVKNYEGWKNLLLINKAIKVDYEGFIPEKLLLTLGKGLACVISKESEFNYYISNKKLSTLWIAKYKKRFDALYYQIDTLEYTSEQLFKRHLENLDSYLCNYRKLVKPILINDSYYLDKDESELKSMLNKVDGKASPEAKDQYFKSVGDTVESYQEWLEDVEPLFNAVILGIENANKLSESVDFKINTGERKLPHFEVKDVTETFFDELEKGIKERLGHLPKKKLAIYLKAIENECNVIVPNGLCDYFMILWDVIKWCKTNGINVGTGRGSVCGSLIAYCLHITDVDPLQYGLMFERFLNETRVSGERAKSADSMPDIDLDFPTAHRDDVKEYIKQKYGADYTCSIGTYTRMKLKTCIKDFGKVKGLSFDYTNKLTKDIDDQIEYTWGDLISYASQSKELFKFVQGYPDIVHLTKYALLQPKAESVHPSALIIVPKFTVDGTNRPIDIWEWMPVKKIDGVLVSEWEGKYVDKSGFLKEDILGLSQLDKFKSILDLIYKNSGVKIDLNKLPLDDEDTFEMFKRGWNEDVFQFGTKGLSTYCKQVKPDTLENLIAMTALFRPGPMDVNAHSDFADIKNGKKKPSYDFGMEKITEETLGLYVYQEQIMKAVVVGGLTEVESDVLRTTIKKKDVKTLSSYGEKFKKGYAELLRKNDIDDPEDYANRVWDKLLAFSGYGFNKSHAAAYSIMSYWSQYLKVKYPLEFWTTALQFSQEKEVPFRLMEIKRSGVELEIRPPDINRSDLTFTCDPKEKRIFFSLTKIKSVGEVAVKHLIETRDQGGQFFSLEEFMSRVPSKVNKTVIKNLIISGAFDLIEGITKLRQRKDILQKFYEIRREQMPEEYKTIESESNDFWTKLQIELTGVGEIDFASLIEKAVPKRLLNNFVDGKDFEKTKIGKQATVAGFVRSVRMSKIKSNGKTMCNMKIESNQTEIPILVWPDALETFSEDLTKLEGTSAVIAINGDVKKDSYFNEKKLYSNRDTRLYVVKL